MTARAALAELDKLTASLPARVAALVRKLREVEAVVFPAAVSLPPAPAARDSAPAGRGQRGAAAGDVAGPAAAVGAAVSEACAAVPTYTSTGAESP